MKVIDSLGFIEVLGFVAGIEAADAMLKSASVRLIRQHEVHPGLVTLVIEGDLAACRAAVNAGSAAASRVGVVLGSHVIGRPDGDTESMILNLIPQSLADYKGKGSLNNDASSIKDDASNNEPQKVVSVAEQKKTQATPKINVGSSPKVVTSVAVPVKKDTSIKQTAPLKQATTKSEGKVVETKKAELITKPITKSVEAKTPIQKIPTDQKSVEQKTEEAKSQIVADNEKKIVSTVAQVKTASSIEPNKPTSQNDKKAPSIALKNQLEQAAAIVKQKSDTTGKKTVETVAPVRSELDQAIEYILLAQRGYTWSEISKHFPKHSKQLQQKLDRAVVSGKIIKVGARYCKPNKE
ncbi:BMC domain-containing protein [Neisseria sp. Ec49-e6-T10]|uniref:BMC domain-containing protein n=1 Tax=Neisseria sp. Ec49-e6-T10 TaxID=3140744 RepID=UPI003EBE797A